jgi:hypothetical protein
MLAGAFGRALRSGCILQINQYLDNLSSQSIENDTNVPILL